MFWGSVLSRLFRPSMTRNKPIKNRSVRLRAELLESREVPFAPTFFVTNGNDSGPGSLRDAIEQAESILADADEIVIDPSVDVITLASPLPDFLESHTISATPNPGMVTGVLITPVEEHFQQFRFAEFKPTAGVLTLNGIELAGFGTNSPDPIESMSIRDGGAIYSLGSLQLYNCSIHDCLSTGNGGAVALDKLLTVNTSLFFDNTSVGAGGAIYSLSTSVIVWSISNSNFAANLALGGNGMYSGGGAIFLQTANSSSFTCTQTYFSTNHAEGNGGAICMISGILTVTGTVPPAAMPPGFIGNSARGVGGAIYTLQSTSVYVDVPLMGGNYMFLPNPSGPPTQNNVWVQFPIPQVNVFIAPNNAPFVIVPIGP